MTLTDIFIVSTIVVILGADLLFAVTKGGEATISSRLSFWAMRYPIVALLFGILMGHLFFPNCPPCAN